MTSLLYLYGTTALVAGAAATAIEGAELVPSIMGIGLPAAAGSYITTEFLKIPYKKDPKGLAWFVGASGLVAVGILAATGQVPVALDSPTLMLVLLTGGSAAVGSLVAADYPM